MAISPSSTTSSPLFSCVWPSLLNSFLIRAENHHLPPLISSSLDNHHHLCPSWLSPPPSLGFSPVRNQQWHYPASSVQWAALSLPASFRLVTITISGFLFVDRAAPPSLFFSSKRSAPAWSPLLSISGVDRLLLLWPVGQGLLLVAWRWRPKDELVLTMAVDSR